MLLLQRASWLFSLPTSHYSCGRKTFNFSTANYLCAALEYNWRLTGKCAIHPGALEEQRKQDPPKSKVAEACWAEDRGSLWAGQSAGNGREALATDLQWGQGNDWACGQGRDPVRGLCSAHHTAGLPGHPRGLGKTRPCRNNSISSCKCWGWKASYSFAVEHSSLNKASPPRLGRAGLSSLKFRELWWLKEAGGVRKHVTGRQVSHFSLNQSQWWAQVLVAAARGKNGSAQS